MEIANSFTCEPCGGSGIGLHEYPDHPHPCPTCHGSGSMRLCVPCKQCGGRGYRSSYPGHDLNRLIKNSCSPCVGLGKRPLSDAELEKLVQVYEMDIEEIVFMFVEDATDPNDFTFNGQPVTLEPSAKGDEG